MADLVRLRATITIDYEAEPGSDAYDGETDVRKMAAIDAESDPADMLLYASREAAVGMTVAPTVDSEPLREFADWVASLDSDEERRWVTLSAIIARARGALLR